MECTLQMPSCLPCVCVASYQGSSSLEDQTSPSILHLLKLIITKTDGTRSEHFVVNKKKCPVEPDVVGFRCSETNNSCSGFNQRGHRRSVVIPLYFERHMLITSTTTNELV